MPAQYSQFVPQHEDLKLFEVGRPAQQTKKLENAVKNDVQDGQEHGTSYGRQPRGPLFYANRISAPHRDSVFRQAEKETEEYQDHRGLCPHWIYEHSGDDGAERNSLMVRRHVFCYEDSRDVAAYDRIRQDLALYRLAFGQPRQEDLIRSLRPTYSDTLKNGAGQFLRQFMFDLTPFESEYAWKAALRRARVELAGESAKQWCRRLAIRATNWLVKHGDRLKTAPNVSTFDVVLAAEALIKYVDQASIQIHDPRQKALVHAAATLLYVVNAYDDIHDVYGPTGLIDDMERIKRAYTILPLAASLDEYQGISRNAR